MESISISDALSSPAEGTGAVAAAVPSRGIVCCAGFAEAMEDAFGAATTSAGRGVANTSCCAGEPARRLAVRAATRLPAPGRIVPSAMCFFFQLLSLFPEIPAYGDERAPAPLPSLGNTTALASCG
jgi:hypothetical protein